MQKPEGIEDLRIRRTRKLLQRAFIELTVEKGFTALRMNVVFPHEARIDPADGASVSRGVCFTKREWQTEIAPV